MSNDQERWAEAIAGHRVHGERSAEHVAGRIGSLAVAGDDDGVERWIAIARRLYQLLAGNRQLEN